LFAVSERTVALGLAVAALATFAGLAAALPPGAGVTVTVAARARGGGTIRNVAVATHSRGDPTRGNNVDSAVIHVTGVSGAVRPSFTG
jgi:hypothetical protein